MFLFERFGKKGSHAEAEPGRTAGPGEHVVAVFGAGASMAAGGVGVADIFRRGFTARWAKHSGWAKTLKAFLRDVFCVRDCDFDKCANLPDIILVLSLVDLAIDRGDALIAQHPRPKHKVWLHAHLIEVREKLEGLIIKSVLDPYLDQFRHQRSAITCEQAVGAFVHEIFLDYLHRQDPHFSLISMNYDMYLERAAMQHLEWLRSQTYDESVTSPTYSVAFEQPQRHRPGIRTLHKLHGSCDWAHCSGCGRISLLNTSRYLKERGLREEKLTLESFMKQLLGAKQAQCGRCGSMLRPVIIPPTLVKNYSNSHIRHVWSHAERELQRCTEIYFVGYAMAADDLEFISMLKRHTQDVDRDKIHVITPDEGAIWRYHSVFGRSIDIQLMRFEEWVAANCARTALDYCQYARSRRKALSAHPRAAAAVRERRPEPQLA